MCSWRRDKHVLVDEAEHNIGIGVIRSLGRAGYKVTACSSDPDALGLSSRFATRTEQCPSPFRRQEFLRWLDATIAAHRIDAIIPTEGLLTAIEPTYSSYAHLLPYSTDKDVLYGAISKYRMVSRFLDPETPQQLQRHMPPSLLVNSTAQLPTTLELGALPMPIYAKTDFLNSPVGAQSSVHRLDDIAAAGALLTDLGARYSRFLVQGHVEGVGVGVFVVVRGGKILARFMHRRLHEFPHTGGVSSFRQSWWHDAIHADACERIRHLDWQGPLMLEYRWNPRTDEFHLIELNCRFWGSLHLALYAGVDFPRILVDAMHGHFETRQPEFRLGVRCRDTFPTEARHVGSRLRDDSISALSKVWSVLCFVGLTLNPRVHADLLFPGDQQLYWKALLRYVRGTLGSLRDRLRSRKQTGDRAWAEG